MRHLMLAASVLLLSQGAALAEEVPDISEARRIVAIGGSVTEIVYALGEEERLVARDSTSLFPESALALPDVGYMRALSPEGVLSVDPDAIIAIEGSGPPEAVEVLNRARIPVITVPERFDRDGVLEKVRVIGTALGVDEAASELAARIEADLVTAEERAVPGDPARVLFVLSMQGGKVLASGTGTAADGIVRMAGGVNVIDAFEGYRQVSDEAVIEAAPDIVVMMNRAGDHAIADEALFTHPAIAPTPAGLNRRILRMDGGLLLGFGPRTGTAVRDLAAAFDTVAD